ncbi:MAG: DUF1592 domain-containing protein, partial [Chthoniobacteraceae bacterium]
MNFPLPDHRGAFAWTKWSIALALLFAMPGARARGEILEAAGGEPKFQPQIQRLLEDHCYDCHGEGMKKGEFDLEGLLQLRGNEANGHWKKVWDAVRQGFMPPVDADPLQSDSRKAITRWIAEQQLGVDFENPDPGRVTMRRLNRMEYEFTVTDLFGADFQQEGRFKEDPRVPSVQLREMLPPDDTAFGFDNIGDFQTLSPALLDKYFNLAEFVIDRTILVNGPRPREQQLPGDQVRIEKNQENGVATHQLTVPVAKSGRYRVAMQFRMGGWHDGDGSYALQLALGGKPLAREMVETGGEKVYTLAGQVELEPGDVVLNYTTSPADTNERGTARPLELRPRLWLIGPLDSDLEYPESHRRIFTRESTPNDPAEREAYAREIMQRIAGRAFRRPVDEGMLARLTALVMSAPKFEQGIAQGMMAILVSPNFLFRNEIQPQPDDPKSIHPLDEFSLASRLSFFLWLSVPDDELTGLAGRGELRKNLRQQVKRMLDDPKSARFFEDFTGQWLRTRNVLMTPVSRGTEDPIDGLRWAMKRETDLFFEDIARNDRDLLELVTADYTFVNRELAEYYGIPAADEPGFQRVEIPPGSNRGGVLTHASFLISTSNPNRTSPVKRGLFVLENLLSIHPPPPPPTVGSLEDVKTLDGRAPRTVREQLELHRAEKSCAACHAHFDPIGIALENYSVTGRWRTEDNGVPITPDETTISGQRLTGIADLKQYFIDNKAQYYACVSEKLLTYALGRGLEPSDSVLVERMASQLQVESGKFSTLLLAVIESAPFQTRRGDDGAQKTAPALAVPPIPPPEKRKGR